MACILIVSDNGTDAGLVRRMKGISESTSAVETIITAGSCFNMPTIRDEYTIDVPVPELPPLGENGEFIAHSGRIKQHWDGWRSKYIFWEPVAVAQGKCIIFNKRFRRRFQGFNHGRHWDRKRR
jgi:hypothetical protein